MDESRSAPVSLRRRLIRRVRAILQRIVVPDHAQLRADVQQFPAAIQASFDLGRAVATKADMINEKLDALLGQFDALRRRQDELAEDIATIDALSWDRAALARRLAQIEDRLIAMAPELTAEGGDAGRWPPVRFPGLDRYEDRVKARNAEASEVADVGGQSRL